MTLRKVLQIEIWSKQTTRKILLGFGGIGVVLLLFYTVDRYWISPSERNSARVALASLDALEPWQTGSDQQFEVIDSQAKEKVDAAMQVSLTSRDKLIALSLFIYLSGIEVERQDQKMRTSSDERLRKLLITPDPQVTQLEHQIHEQVGQNLHRVLK